jgi:hypothetical protein
MSAFRSWPSKVVVAGVDPDTATYIGYSPIVGAQLAAPVWVVEKISAAGANVFAASNVVQGEADPEPNAVMTAPQDLTFAARA